jgi:CheY-like chemotaxis protein
VEDGDVVVVGEILRPPGAASDGHDLEVRAEPSRVQDAHRKPAPAPLIDDADVEPSDAPTVDPLGGIDVKSTDDPDNPDAPDAEPARTSIETLQQVAEGADSSKQHIALVIDDDAEGAEMLQSLLEAEDFRVIVAGTGKEGLKIARTQQLSIITLDVRLPGVNGWGFLLRLHEYSEFAAVPIVLVAGDGDVSLALTHGAAAVLEKPISQEALQQALEAIGLNPDARRTRRVLVADDDPETVDVIARYLTRPEYVIECASSKEDAIAMAQQLRPDLILLNLMMEEFSGYQRRSISPCLL